VKQDEYRLNALATTLSKRGDDLDEKLRAIQTKERVVMMPTAPLPLVENAEEG
jgi:hypothetical protein